MPLSSDDNDLRIVCPLFSPHCAQSLPLSGVPFSPSPCGHPLLTLQRTGWTIFFFSPCSALCFPHPESWLILRVYLCYIFDSMALAWFVVCSLDCEFMRPGTVLFSFWVKYLACSKWRNTCFLEVHLELRNSEGGLPGVLQLKSPNKESIFTGIVEAWVCTGKMFIKNM